jgi:hypothetical protein
MYWNEKIDLVKKKFPSEFKDPFRAGPEIIKKIATILFETTLLNLMESEDRAGLLKQGTLTKLCSLKHLYHEELPRLNNGSNYWLLLIEVPMGSNFQVYDCKYQALKELVHLSSGQDHQELCIVDKKYAWLLFFKIDRTKDMVKIYNAERSK